jgi:hypothetical protein
LAVNSGTDVDGYWVWERDGTVLVPPARHHDGNVEAQDEGYRNVIGTCVTIFDRMLEPSKKTEKISFH